MTYLKKLEQLVKQNQSQIFKVARIEHKSEYKAVVIKDDIQYKIVIISDDNKIIGRLYNFQSKTAKILFEMLDVALTFSFMQNEVPVLEEGFIWVRLRNTALDKHLRYNPILGVLKGEILDTPFYLQTETPVNTLNEDMADEIVENATKIIFTAKKENTKVGDLDCYVYTTKQNVGVPKHNDAGEDDFMVYFTGAFGHHIV